MSIPTVFPNIILSHSVEKKSQEPSSSRTEARSRSSTPAVAELKGIDQDIPKHKSPPRTERDAMVGPTLNHTTEDDTSKMVAPEFNGHTTHQYTDHTRSSDPELKPADATTPEPNTSPSLKKHEFCGPTLETHDPGYNSATATYDHDEPAHVHAHDPANNSTSAPSHNEQSSNRQLPTMEDIASQSSHNEMSSNQSLPTLEDIASQSSHNEMSSNQSLPTLENSASRSGHNEMSSNQSLPTLENIASQSGHNEMSSNQSLPTPEDVQHTRTCTGASGDNIIHYSTEENQTEPSILVPTTNGQSWRGFNTQHPNTDVYVRLSDNNEAFRRRNRDQRGTQTSGVEDIDREALCSFISHEVRKALETERKREETGKENDYRFVCFNCPNACKCCNNHIAMTVGVLFIILLILLNTCIIALYCMHVVAQYYNKKH